MFLNATYHPISPHGILQQMGWTMTNYLVDSYTELGKIFRSDRIVAQNDIGAELLAIQLAFKWKPHSYKITSLGQLGNDIIRDRTRLTADLPALSAVQTPARSEPGAPYAQPAPDKFSQRQIGLAGASAEWRKRRIRFKLLISKGKRGF